MFKFGSVCSGIEAASIAWEPLGARAEWLSETGNFQSEVLNYQWPDVPNLGDMCKLPNLIRAHAISAPDVLIGGTPCQTFSVAGARKSLDDDRGQLTLTFVDLLNAIDEQKEQNEKCIAVWENVPGALSTKDNAFGTFLGAIVGETSELVPAGRKWTNAGIVYGPNRTAVWRVLDAQYFGVPQRRRRLFVVASARKGLDIGSILFECSSPRRDIKPSKKTESQLAGNNNDSASNGKIVTVHGTQSPITLDNLALPLGLNNGSENAIVNLLVSDSIRKLTPIECERLQGLPDNHTRIAYNGKPVNNCPNGLRYKAIGNSMAVPVINWIGKRLITQLKNSNGGCK